MMIGWGIVYYYYIIIIIIILLRPHHINYLNIPNRTAGGTTVQILATPSQFDVQTQIAAWRPYQVRARRRQTMKQWRRHRKIEPKR